MKDNIIDIVNNYKKNNPEELDKLKPLDEFLNNYSNFYDWNNFEGHVVASMFIYNEETNKVLMVFHDHLKMYLSTGGHIDDTDTSIKDAAIREMMEESGITNYKSVSELIDIDIHTIPYNESLNLPSHTHFDFRYLCIVDNSSEINIDTNELGGYKWVSMDEFMDLTYLNDIRLKIKNIIE